VGTLLTGEDVLVGAEVGAEGFEPSLEAV
jgi:hypothetical protein